MALSVEDGAYVVQCDHCQQQYKVRATAYRKEQFVEMAEGLGWTFDTEHGDLCGRCARSWRAGKLKDA